MFPLRLAGIVLVVVALAGFATFKLRQQPTWSVSPGSPAPTFTLPRLDGGTTTLTSFRGKVVLVNFWATWCPPCLEEMPSLEDLHQKFKARPFVLLAVNIDENGMTAAAPFARRLGLTFPILLDPPQEATRLYHLTGVPETYLIGPDGTIVEKILGPRNWTDPAVLSPIEKLLRSLPG